MRTRASIHVKFLIVFALLGVAGIAATIFVLANQRVRSPFEAVYTVRAQFTAANGVVGGIGQPVNVVGVKVGQVTDVSFEQGLAVVTLEIRRDKLPELHSGTTATLKPVTPLHNMEVDLVPGRDSRPVLEDGALIGTQDSTVPVPLSELLSRLDGDTRTYLSGLIGNLERGTRGRAPDLRRLLLSMGPTARQAGQISGALAARRTRLAEFVHTLALVTRAASRDSQLRTVVSSGQETLHAISTQDEALRGAIRELPPTLAAASGTFQELTPFAKRLDSTVDALLPSVRRLPATLRDIGSFSGRGTSVLRNQLRPLVRAGRPVVRDGGAAIEDLEAAAAPLTGTAQTLNYVFNELSYVPGGEGGEQGYLFWTDWFAHNLNSVGTTGDANGAILRAVVLFTCGRLLNTPVVEDLLEPFGGCT